MSSQRKDEKEFRMNVEVTHPAKATNHEVHAQLKHLVKSERKITFMVLTHLIEVDKRKIYLEHDCTNLYKYLTKELGYSEDAAYDRKNAAKILGQHPELAAKLMEGKINLTQLVKLSSAMKQAEKEGRLVNPEARENILSQLENKNSYDTMKILAQELNLTPKQGDSVKPQRDESVRYGFTLSKEDNAIFKDFLSLMSHIVYDQDIADSLMHVVKLHVKKIRGKESFNKEKKFAKNPATQKSFTTQPFRTIRSTPRKKLPLKTQRLVMEKAGHRCEYENNPSKERCTSTYQLQIDHITPLARGGTDDVANLRVLCAEHNRLEAKKWGLHPPR
jgi:hypothetical protein